jgi:hypothetical protein
VPDNDDFVAHVSDRIDRYLRIPSAARGDIARRQIGPQGGVTARFQLRAQAIPAP